jgi:hypothetical protein
VSHDTRPKSPLVSGPRVGTVRSPIPDLTLPGAKTIKDGGLQVGQINVPQIQKFLKSRGYDLAPTGQLDNKTKLALANFLNPANTGSVLSAALKGYRITGDRNPQKWNVANGTVKTKSPVINTFDPATGASKDPPSSPAGTVDLRGLGSIAQGLGTQPIPAALAAKLANETAGAQYDPQIHDLQTELARDPVQAKQNQADIGNWYGQVASARKTAAGRDTAISGAGISSMKDALAAIESSLGGSANAGTGDVANAGENAIGTLTALGANQDQYNADLAPLLALESASAKAKQSAADTLAEQNHQQSLQDAQGARGQLYGQTLDTNTMNITNANNALAQQGFSNKLAIQQAAEAAQLSGLKALQLAQKTTLSPKGSFGAATTTDIQNVQNAVLKHVLDANGNPLPGMTAAKAAIIAQQVGSTFFPGGGVTPGWATQVVSPFFSTQQP